MKKWLLLALATLLVAGGAWYAASPALAMSGLKDAVQEGDKDEMAERIDFPAVRESLKAQFRAAMMAEMAKQKDNPFAGLGMAMAGAMIDPMIDGLVSPSGMKALVENGKFKRPGDDTPAAASDQRDWTIERSGMDKFLARPEAKAGEEAPALVFKRDGLSWRLVDIEVPTKNPESATEPQS